MKFLKVRETLAQGCNELRVEVDVRLPAEQKLGHSGSLARELRELICLDYQHLVHPKYGF